MPSRDPTEATVWERGFRARYDSIRGSIRALQIDFEHNLPQGSANKKHLLQLGVNVDSAWDALTQQPQETTRRRPCNFIGNANQLKALEAELGLGDK